MNNTHTLTDLDMQRLNTCDDRLKTLVLEVAKDFPLTVMYGNRGEADQHQAFVSGHSKLDWPNSKHNSLPSVAVDIAPYPYDPKGINRIVFLAGFVLGTAARLGISIRWGGDWNMNMVMSDEHFPDLFHFELH